MCFTGNFFHILRSAYFMYKSGFKNKTILFKMHGFNIFCVKRNLSKLDAAGVVSCTFSKISGAGSNGNGRDFVNL